MDYKYTMKGYSLLEWAKRNKDDLKLIFSGIMGIVIGSISNVQIGALATVLTKLGVDAIDYWLKE